MNDMSGKFETKKSLFKTIKKTKVKKKFFKI